MSEVILIVDDNFENIFLIKSLLKTSRYETLEANSGQEALDILDQHPVDLVLLDVMMPGMDGFEVCKRMRENPAVENIPVIFLTAKNDPESINHGLTIGGNDYVTKPFQMKELLARVSNHIQHRITQVQLEQSNQKNQELLHILSHDLSNPLSSIVSLSEVIEDEPAMSTQFNPRIKELAENGLELVSLIRQMRSLESKGLELTPVSLQEATARCLKFNQDRAQEKGITLVVEEFPGSLWVQAELTSLVNTVLSNLVTNAIKFSVTGSTIAIRASRDPGQVFLEVIDHGIGMSETLLSQVFDVTKKTSRSGTEAERGTGFGMPLVKQFIEHYGGTIELSSNDGVAHGTAVKLTFVPAEAPALSSGESGSAEAPESRAELWDTKLEG